MSSNRREGHEISLLALHFNQNCMIYINQFDYQNIISEATLARQKYITRLCCADTFGMGTYKPV